MIESFLFGSGIKIVSNIVSAFMSNSRQNNDNVINVNKDHKWLKAQKELQIEINKDPYQKIARLFIYLMITGTFCTITLYAMIFPEKTDILVKTSGGFLSKILFRQPDEVVQNVHISGIVFKDCLQVMIAVLGAFVTPSVKN